MEDFIRKILAHFDNNILRQYINLRNGKTLYAAPGIIVDREAIEKALKEIPERPMTPGYLGYQEAEDIRRELAARLDDEGIIGPTPDEPVEIPF